MKTYFLTAFPRYTNVNTARPVIVEQRETNVNTMAPVDIQTTPRYYFMLLFDDHVGRLLMVSLFTASFT